MYSYFKDSWAIIFSGWGGEGVDWDTALLLDTWLKKMNSTYYTYFYCASYSVLSTSMILTPINPHNPLEIGYYDFPHFTLEETGTQRLSDMQRFRSQLTGGWGFGPRESVSRVPNTARCCQKP